MPQGESCSNWLYCGTAVAKHAYSIPLHLSAVALLALKFRQASQHSAALSTLNEEPHFTTSPHSLQGKLNIIATGQKQAAAQIRRSGRYSKRPTLYSSLRYTLLSMASRPSLSLVMAMEVMLRLGCLLLVLMQAGLLNLLGGVAGGENLHVKD